MDRFKIISQKKIDQLPKTSGVYTFLSGTDLLYIGKAVNIKERVKNHFSRPSYRDNLFAGKINKIGYFQTNSEIEALILEANLIKKYQPKYNVMWRDDKNYFYVAVANAKDKFPYVFITHQPGKLQTTKTQGVPQLQTKYIGPFVEGTALKKTLRFLRRVFPHYTAKKHPKLKCLYCHLGLCPGPEPDLKEYKKNIKKLVLILRGKRGAVLMSLVKEMKQLSKERKFEEAAKIRDRISNLRQVMAHTHVIEGMDSRQNPDGGTILAEIIGAQKPISRIECYDVSNIQGKSATGAMVAFVDGKPNKNLYRKFHMASEGKPNDILMLKETITRRLSHKEWKYPDLMLIDGGRAQLNIAIKAKNQNEKTKNIKIISIAKRNKDLYIEGKSGFIPLKNLPREIYNLILQLDDEAHRFAISYHKKLRRNNLLR